MCSKIIINRGEKEIQSLNDFLSFFKNHNFPFLDAMTEKTETCLCAIDIEAFLKSKGFSFKTYLEDFYIGQLEDMKDFDLYFQSQDKTDLALKINKFVHDNCENVSHDIGLRIVDLIDNHPFGNNYLKFN